MIVKFIIIGTLLVATSCSSWLYPDDKGKNEEEKLYNRVKLHMKNEQFLGAYMVVEEIEKNIQIVHIYVS